MNIQSITYTDLERTSITIKHADQTIIVPLPCNTWHKEFIEEWLNDGNSIGEHYIPIEEIISDQLSQILEISQFEVDVLVLNEYPEFERQTWADQEKEAIGIINEGNFGAPILSEISAARNIELTVLAQKVIEKASRFRQIAAKAAGTRQALEDQIQNIKKEYDDSKITYDQAKDKIEAVQWTGLML